MTWKAEEFCGDLRIVDGDGEVIAELRNPNSVYEARLISESPTMSNLLQKLQAVRSPRELHNLRCEVAEVLARIEGA